MKILLTGAHGFLGQAIAKEIAATSHQLLAPTRQELDLLDHSEVKAYIEKHRPEVVIHNAWYTVHGKFWAAPENIQWREASLALAKTFAEAGGKRFLGLGTCAEYSWKEDGVCVEGKTPLIPETLYGQQKNLLRQELQTYFDAKAIEFLWARIFFPYGPGEKGTRLIPIMMQALLDRKPVALSAGHQRRDFMYRDDIASLVAQLALSKAQGEVNISTGVGISIREIGAQLVQLTGAPAELLQFSSEPLREPELLIGSTKGREKMLASWAPKVSLKMGLEQSLQFWKKDRDTV